MTRRRLRSRRMIDDIMKLPGVSEARIQALSTWKEKGGAKPGDIYTYNHTFTYEEGITDVWIPGAMKGGVKEFGMDLSDLEWFGTQHFLGSYTFSMQILSDGKTILYSLADSKTKESATDHQIKGNSIDRKDNENIQMGSTYQRYIWMGEIQIK